MLYYKVRTKAIDSDYNRHSYPIVVADSVTGCTIYTAGYEYFYKDHDHDVVKGRSYKAEAYELARILNWLNNHKNIELRRRFKKYGLMVFDYEVATDYLKDHQYGRISGMRSKEPYRTTQISVRARVTQILMNIYRRYYPEDTSHWFRKREISAKYASYLYEITIELNGRSRKDRLIRHCPDEVVQMCIDEALNNDIDLVFAIDLMRYAGLRKSEVCNVRGKTSIWGPGIVEKWGKKKIHNLKVDLTTEYRLRSDGKSTGLIKCPRYQYFPPCIWKDHPEILNHYLAHANHLEDADYEEYAPFFVNDTFSKKTGKQMAMTVSSLDVRFRELFIKHVMPKIENGNNQQLKDWLVTLKGHTWGLHWFRYSFTMDLVNHHCTVTQIKRYRGDSELKSAETYLMRSPELKQALSEGNFEVMEEILADICRLSLEY